MATTAEKLGKYAVELRYADLPGDVVHYTKRLLIDTLGCALGGFTSEPSRIARKVIAEIGGNPECTVIGSGQRTSCPNATLANGMMSRYLDFNDTYLGESLDFAHASENIATALAVGERQHASGKDVITAIALGYECHHRFMDVWNFYETGWSHVNPSGYIAPVMAGKLLGLSERQIANAIGIGGSHNHALRGMYLEQGTQMNMMKCAGWHFAAQSGVVAALLARNDFTGPTAIIESLAKVMGGTPDLSHLVPDGPTRMIMKSCIKAFASYYMSHSPITALLELRNKHRIRPADVKRIDVRVYAKALSSFALEPPKTRETADHNLAYLLSIALAEGDVSPEQFAHRQWESPEIVELMSKINLVVDPAFNQLFPKAWPAEVSVTVGNGDVHTHRVDYSRGTPQNPMSDRDIEAKFRGMASKIMSDAQIERIFAYCYELEAADDVAPLMQLLTV